MHQAPIRCHQRLGASARAIGLPEGRLCGATTCCIRAECVGAVQEHGVANSGELLWLFELSDIASPTPLAAEDVAAAQLCDRCAVAGEEEHVAAVSSLEDD